MTLVYVGSALLPDYDHLLSSIESHRPRNVVLVVLSFQLLSRTDIRTSLA
jgi:hypothetical protein